MLLTTMPDVTASSHRPRIVNTDVHYSLPNRAALFPYLAAIFALLCATVLSQELIDEVNPMIGTTGPSKTEYGGTIPACLTPYADSVIADAYIKGIRGFDLEKAYAATYKNAMTPPDGDENNRWADRAPWTACEARGGLTWYKSLGFVPQDKTAESVSRTLEYAYDDFCVAQLAKAVGKEQDYDLLMQRSRNYQNPYDPSLSFMRPKKADGSWDEASWASGKKTIPGFTEGGPWTYLFCAMQDIPGLIALMGGAEKFAARLDENFQGPSSLSWGQSRTKLGESLNET